MTDWGRAAMEAYARDRGLGFDGDGLLPAVTPFLRRGLGRGSHRVPVLAKETDYSVKTIGGLTERPERYTLNIARGRLPGGLDGVVAHHFNIERNTQSSDAGDHLWVVPHTVVLANVPDGARLARELQVTPPPDPSAGEVLSFTGQSLGNIAPPPGELIDGWEWRTDPPESSRDVQEMAHGLGAWISGAPKGTVVEMRDGSLCVAAPGVVEDPAQLDYVCELASAVAGGATRAAALHPPLDPTAPTRAQVLSPDLQWVEPLTAQIDWAEPPASVPAAQAAYAGLAAEDAARTGRTVSGAAFLVLVVVGLIWFAGDALLAVALHQYGAALIAAVIGVGAIPFAISAARSAGKEEAEGQVADRSKLPGLEAFVREYAGARGMALEDRDEFRRRFTSPIPGAPIKVMYGRLGGDVTGRLVLWMSRGERFEAQYWNMAVVPLPAGAIVPSIPGYQAMRAGDALVLAEPVPNEGRSVERLDALRAAAIVVGGG